MEFVVGLALVGAIAVVLGLSRLPRRAGHARRLRRNDDGAVIAVDSGAGDCGDGGACD